MIFSCTFCHCPSEHFLSFAIFLFHSACLSLIYFVYLVVVLMPSLIKCEYVWMKLQVSFPQCSGAADRCNLLRKMKLYLMSKKKKLHKSFQSCKIEIICALHSSEIWFCFVLCFIFMLFNDIDLGTHTQR